MDVQEASPVERTWGKMRVPAWGENRWEWGQEAPREDVSAQGTGKGKGSSFTGVCVCVCAYVP
eukprot:7647773-Alexandrium_andersonii.AAC.1